MWFVWWLPPIRFYIHNPLSSFCSFQSMQTFVLRSILSGSTWNYFDDSLGRSTTDNSHPKYFTVSANFPYPPSAIIFFSLENIYWSRFIGSTVPTLSWILAAWTFATSGNPSVSTIICSFLPLIFFPPSMLYSLLFMWWEVLTLPESMSPIPGLIAFPKAFRTDSRRWCINFSKIPSDFHLRE